MARLDVRIAPAVAVALALPAAAAAGEPETFVLPNGLRVVLQVEDLPLADVHVHYPVGPQTEPEGLEGIAHYLEHLMFTSSRRHPDGGLATELELLTAHRSGSTHRSHTSYRSECLPELLPALLELEAERMSALEPSADELARERSVVLEEIAYRNPSSSAYSQLWGEVFTASFPGHPFGRPISGTLESMGRVGEAELRTYRDAHHGPTGALLVVVGPFDPVAVRGIVESAFGGIPPNPVPVPAVPPLPDPPRGVTVEIDRHDDEGLRVLLGFRLPRETDRDFVLVRLLEELLEDGLSVGLSVLPGEYFFTVSNAWSYLRTGADGRATPVDAASDARGCYQATWRRIRDRMEEVLKPEPFAALLNDTVARYRRVRADPTWYAEIAGRRWLLDERFPEVAAFEQAARALSREEVKGYVTERIHPSRAVFGVAHGKDSGRMRDLPPPSRVGPEDEGLVLPARGFSAERVEPLLAAYGRGFPEPIRTSALASGQTVHTVALRGATYGLVLGARFFPPRGDEKKGKKRGLTWAYNRLLRTARADRESERDGRLPPALEIRATPSAFLYRAWSTPSRTGESIRALWACLEDDRLDVERWHDVHRWMESTPRDLRLRGHVRAEIRRWEMLFGEESPVLGALVPEPAEGRMFTYKQMQELHRWLRRQEGLRIFVVTDPAHADSAAVLDATFASAKSKGRGKPAPPEVRLDGIRGEVIADFQAQDVELALDFPPFPVGRDEDPGWAAAELSRLIVESRLKGRLREQEGLAYSCRVTFRWVGDALLPELETAIRPGDALRAYRVTQEELRRLARDGFDDGELLRARLALVKQRARWWSDVDRAYADLARMARHGAPPFDPVAAILGAEAREVQAALGAWLDPERYCFTLCGPLLEEEIARF